MAARPAAGAPRPPPPSLRPTLPAALPCPVPPVPGGPWRPCPCPWAPFRPPARAVGPAPGHPRPGLPARPPSLAPLHAPGRPARAPARPSRALAPSRLPALSRAVRCPRSVPLRCCALAPCRVCPGPPPVPGFALPWLARSSACAPFPPSWITRRVSRCLCSCGSVTPGGERLGAGGRTCRVRPGGKGLEGNGLGGLVWVWVGLAWARYFAPSLPTAAAAAAAGEAPVARAGSFPRLRGVLGAVAWPAEAVARLAGAAVATPRAPSPLPFCGCGSPRRCARFLRRGYPPCRRRARGRVRGPGVARWGCGLRSPRVWGPLPGRGGRACCLGGGGGHLGQLRLLGRPPGVGRGRPGLPSRQPDQHRRPRQPPLLALRGGLPRPLRGDEGAGAGPAVVAVVPLGGAIGVCHHCYPGRHAWWQVRPSHYLPVHQCRAVGSAVQCSAGGEGGRGWGAGCGISSVRAGAGGHPWALGGRRGSHAAHASCHSSQSGAGLRALGPRGSSGGAGGGRTRWTRVTAVTSCVPREVCTPSRAAGAGRGGRGTGAAP